MRQVAGKAALAGLAVVAALGLVAGGALAARADNGIAGKSPDAILATSLAAGEHAHSVRIVGNIVSGGSHIGMDIRFSGAKAKGRLSEDGVTFDLVLTPGKAFVKGGAAFWQKEGGTPGDPTIKLLANTWVGGSTATGKPFAAFGNQFRLRGLLQSLSSSHGPLEVAGTTKIHGRPALGLRDTKQGGTIYIATTGKPYPLSIQKTKGSDTGTLEFEDWDTPMTIAAPATYIDLDKLGKTGKP
ncbi:MAG TPA: hypothetical protein VHC45_16480 [Gaiellaceae bacterium]|jgi:hypothetical protein|nr:hypothetical protein [Gaiellaceae bacterium]